MARLAGAGTAADELIVDLLAPAEREVGARWARREWSVAQEHAATAVVDAALAMLALEHEPALPTGARRAVVACVEGEWHSLPARMAAELLRLEGWDVVFLGPSVPADDLGAHVRDLEPDVAGLSCSVPLFLTGAQRSIEACRDAGVPVVAGGAGFGEAGEWSVALGAAAWLPDARSAGGALAGAGADPPPPRPAPDPDQLVLEVERPALVASAVDAVRAAPGGAPAAALAELGEAAGTLLASIGSACLVGDARVVAACVPVVERLLPGALAGLTPAGLAELVLPEVRRRSARAAALAEDGVGRPPAFAAGA